MVACNVSSAFVLCFFLLAQTEAAVVSYDFNVGWLWANPDGLFARPVVAINDQWPLPIIEARVGDTIVVNVYNMLGNQSTSIHFHGLFMNGTTHMDGTSYVSQCAISPGASFVYNFEAQQPGTYWYHSHEKSQYADGLRGMMVIRDAEDPYRAEYDEELIISLSDWYHEQMPDLLKKFDQPENKMRDPTPDSNLINDTVGQPIYVEPFKTYLVRLANIGSFVGQYFWVQDHTMTVVEVDGVYTKPQDTGMIHIAAGQRYAFLLNTKAMDEAYQNFPIISRMDKGSFSSHVPWPDNLDAVTWLTYDSEASFPEPNYLDGGDSIFALDDMSLIPLDEQPLLEPVDKSIPMFIDMKTQEDGIVHWLFNTVRYQLPVLPSLFSALSSGVDAADVAAFEKSTQTFVVEHGQIVEVTIHNKHMWKHPIHLHGHNFQVTNRTRGTIEGPPPGQAPMRRDTIVANGHGWLQFRFRADNPGVWLLHCHMEWHAHSGLKATFVEAPLQLQEQLRLNNVSAILDPSAACDAGRVQVVSSATKASAGVTAGKVESMTALKPTMFIFSIIGVLLAITAIAFLVLRKKPQAYSRLPLAETEDDHRKTEMSAT